MLAFRFFFFFSSVFSSFAIPTRRSSPASFGPYIVFESISQPPDGWAFNGTADPNAILRMVLGLKSNDMDGLEKIIYEVSTPGSPNYGQWLSKEEVEIFAGPSEETKSAVGTWLEANGIKATNASSSGEYVGFNITVSQANTLFQANYTVFTNAVSGKRIIRSLAVSLPLDMVPYVELIHPAIQFPISTTPTIFSSAEARKTRSVSPAIQRRSVSQRGSSSSLNVSACDPTAVLPECVINLYGMPLTVAPQNQSRIGVSGLGDQFAQHRDLSIFLFNFRPDMDDNTTFTLVTLDGGQNIQNASVAGLEANTDIQYTAGIANGIPTEFISVGNDQHDGDLGGFLDLLNSLLARDDPPAVVTTSYGTNEPNVAPSHAYKFCNAAMQLGVRGISILFASGDNGVGGTVNTGQNCTTFVPAFPAGCPFITSVGSTEGVAPETAASFSAGGFSNIFPRPKYQDAAVEAYLKELGTANAGLFNSTGRAYPDVATLGTNIAVVSDNTGFIVNGTSVSSPTFASFIAVVNALRLANNKSTLGFLNPLLYSNSSLLTDITSGSNPACNTNGFPATTGWDPVTGLGTPNFDTFKDLP